MQLKLVIVSTMLLPLSFAASAEMFREEISVAPKMKETVVVQTDVPVAFHAQFVNLDYSEAKKCGNCLHIETVIQGSRNQSASSFGVGFVRIAPEQGMVAVDVFHDFKSAQAIEINVKPYTGRQ
jgi:hypothetical protein